MYCKYCKCSFEQKNKSKEQGACKECRTNLFTDALYESPSEIDLELQMLLNPSGKTKVQNTEDWN